MPPVKRPRLLFAVLGAIAGTVSVVLAVVFFAPPPLTEPEDPFRDVTFTTRRNGYAFDERVGFVLTNLGPLTFQFVGWTMQRLFEGQWSHVECHSATGELRTLSPGETRTWSWTITTPDPYCEVVVTVEEGLYRGWVRLTDFGDFTASGVLYAEFTVA